MWMSGSRIHVLVKQSSKNILTLSDIKIWTEALLAQNCKGLGKLKIAPES